MAQITFDALVELIEEDRHHHVNARLWTNEWSESWVGYSDVLGFAARCKASKATVVNTIVRFHRCVSSAYGAVGNASLGLFQFTDAAFVVSDNLALIQKFTSTLQHYCLAQNSIMLRTKQHPLAHHLILVRSTIAKGSTLTLLRPLVPHLQLLGVQRDALLAGESIVKAYEIEKLTACSQIAFRRDQISEMVADSANLRGNRSRSRSVFEKWGNGESGYFSHDSVIDMPWLLLRSVQDKSELWTDSNEEVFKKTRILYEICALLDGEFLIGYTPIGAAKHRAGLYRHIMEITQSLKGCERPRRWSESKFRSELGI